MTTMHKVKLYKIYQSSTITKEDLVSKIPIY